MSADNVILVQRLIAMVVNGCDVTNKWRWHVWHQSASSPVLTENAFGDVLIFKRKRDALVAAHKLAAEIGYVEYGVTVL